MATTKEIRISQLPLEKDIRGMMTVGVNSANQSVKIPIGEVINEEISKVKRAYGYSRIDALTVESSADDVATALIADNENKRTMPNVGDVLVDWGGVTRVPVVKQTVQTGGEKPIYSFSFRTADNTATKTVKIQGFLYEPQTVVSVETVKDVTQQQISTLDTQLAEEATARLNQDDVLEAKITEEKNARTEADTAINAEIATVKDSVVGKKSETWNGFAEVFNNIDENRATADCAHAEGHQTTASEQAAHAEGKLTVASSPYAHAEGDQTQATASSSHSEGFGTTASGYASHAEGGSTVASGSFTHASGEHTKATNYAEQAIGYYNKSTHVNNNGQWKGDSESTLFSVGNGTSESDRKNAFEVKQDGTVLVQKPGTKQTVKVYDGLMTAEEKASLEQLPTQLTAEQTAREQADTALQTNIDALKATATADANGLMSKEDKATLDALPTRLTTEQTAREQADTAINGEIQGIKDKGTLHDLFLRYGAEYDQSKQKYILNGLELDFNQTLTSWVESSMIWNANNYTNICNSTKMKTNFKPVNLKNFNNPVLMVNMFAYSAIEVVDLTLINNYKSRASNVDNMFVGTGTLRVLKGLILSAVTNLSTFINICRKLEYVELDYINVDLPIPNSPLLKKESILYLLQHAKPNKAITITLHPTAYAMAIADPEIQAELEKQPNISLAEGEPTA